MAIAVTLVALLNFIPIVGWVANYTLVLFGLGAITEAIWQDSRFAPTSQTKESDS